jgi:membrane protein implicated in regulation of membrane protease activity
MIKKHAKPHALAIDALIGQHLIVQEQNNIQVVFREGKYRPIQEQHEHEHKLSTHHKVEILSINGNTLIVKKLV